MVTELQRNLKERVLLSQERLLVQTSQLCLSQLWWLQGLKRSILPGFVQGTSVVKSRVAL